MKRLVDPQLTSRFSYKPHASDELAQTLYDEIICTLGKSVYQHVALQVALIIASQVNNSILSDFEI